ncbi:Translation initiation factor 1A [Rhodotorula kratochvilovae]
MPKGGKNRRRGKNENDGDKRELVFKEEGQEYGQVLKMLGNGRVEAMCFDGEKRLAHIRGKMRKKVWINQGDIVLLSLRDFQDDKADVIQKYSADEARKLKQYGELPETAKINETDLGDGGEGDDLVEFDEVSADEDEDDDDERKDDDFDIARKLKQYGELPETAKINEADLGDGGDGDDLVEFDEVSADEDDDDDDERKDDDFDIVRCLLSLRLLSNG